MPRAGRWSIADIDLEDLAEGYRHRPTQANSLSRAAQSAEHLTAGTWALDVGGGRGDHAAVWLERSIRPVVLDPSVAMTRAAVNKGVAVVRGISQRMPFRENRFGLVRFHLSIHYGDWRAAIGEAVRVMRDDGMIDVWTLGPRHHTSSNLTKWFSRIEAIDGDRFPDPRDIVAELEGRGLVARLDFADEPVERTAGAWVRAVEAGFVSTLQLLTPAEIEDGIARFRLAHPEPEEVLRYHLRFDRIIATTRPLPSAENEIR